MYGLALQAYMHPVEPVAPHMLHCMRWLAALIQALPQSAGSTIQNAVLRYQCGNTDPPHWETSQVRVFSIQLVLKV
jgi:hypothetical protein